MVFRRDKKAGFWERYIHFCTRYHFLFSVICLAGLAATLFYVKGIEVRSSFKEMLPDQYRSVIELNRIEKRVKNAGNLIVIVGGDNWPAMRQFINDFVFRVKTVMADDISDIEYNSSEIRQFYDANKYLYTDLDDLKEVYTRLKRQIDYEKIKQSPFFIEFGEEAPKFDISDIEEKYKKGTGSYQHYADGYFTTDTADLAAILVKPREGATDVDFARHLVGSLKKVADDLNPVSYDPSLKIGFGGRYKKVIEQYEALIGDILKTAILCLFLVGLVLLIYFKRLRMGIWMTLVVVLGTLITLAITRYSIGFLTSQTAFLGSIIVGNGINYSLIIMARFLEERRKDHSLEKSLIHSLVFTWKATLASSLTTSGGFAVLAFTNIKGFSHFGIIGGIGMALCWFSTYLFLPSLILTTEKFFPLDVHKISLKNPFNIIGALGRFVIARYKRVAQVSGVVLLLSVGLMAWYLQNSLEYDFSKLRFESPASADDWETKAKERLTSIFGQSTTPSVVLAGSLEEVRLICASIRERVIREKKEDVFDKCKTIFDYLPGDQEKKLKILSDMRELLSGSTLAFLTEKEKREVAKFRETFNLKELMLTDIPLDISSNFEEAGGERGLIAYVYSKESANLWDGKQLIRFSDLIREVTLPDGKIIYSSGEPAIFSDLLQAVVKEGPKVTVLSLLVIMAIIFATFRRSMTSVMIITTLLVGVVWLIGVLAVVNIKLNFLNFVALPISFGIGVDYAVNIYQRYKEEGEGSMAKVVRTTGAAVALCSLTTIIGYSVLLISSSRALQSFGMVAVIGELTCLAAALISLPAIVTYLENRKAKIIHRS